MAQDGRPAGDAAEDSSRADAEDAASLRACFEHAPVGVAKVSASGDVVLANQALVRLLGGRTPSHLVDLFARPEEARTALDALGSDGAAHRAFEAALATPEREIWALVSASVIPAPAGPGSLMLAFQDMSEQRAVARRLARSEERFKIALANAPTTVFEQDRDLVYRWIFNPIWGSAPRISSGAPIPT